MDPEQQAILARDMIQMIREYQDDADVLEYLESFASSIALGIEDKSIVNWYHLAGICDQRYYSMKYGEPVALNTELLDATEQSIQPHLPKPES